MVSDTEVIFPSAAVATTGCPGGTSTAASAGPVLSDTGLGGGADDVDVPDGSPAAPVLASPDEQPVIIVTTTPIATIPSAPRAPRLRAIPRPPLKFRNAGTDCTRVLRHPLTRGRPEG
ncbi:hypothetical protein GCM10018963_13640 [Saccharothrix longispora]